MCVRYASCVKTVTICTWLKGQKLCRAPRENALMASGSAFKWTLWRESNMSLSHASAWLSEQPWERISQYRFTVSFSVTHQASQHKKEHVLQLALTECYLRLHIGNRGGEIQLNTQTIATHQRCTDICHGKKNQRSGGWSLLGSSVAGRHSSFIPDAVIKYPD